MSKKSKKSKTLKSLSESEKEKCSQCKGWISLDEYILNDSKCESCKAKDGADKPKNH